MSTQPDIKSVLKQAFQLGQTYWQQADSEYSSQWAKSDATLDKFKQLVEETVLAIQPPARQWVEPTEQDLLNIYSQFTDSDGWTYEKAIIQMCKELNAQKARPWFGLSDLDKANYINQDLGASRLDAMDYAERLLKERNHDR